MFCLILQIRQDSLELAAMCGMIYQVRVFSYPSDLQISIWVFKIINHSVFVFVRALEDYYVFLSNFGAILVELDDLVTVLGYSSLYKRGVFYGVTK